MSHLEAEVAIKLNGVGVVFSDIKMHTGNTLHPQCTLKVLNQQPAQSGTLGARKKIDVEVGWEAGHNLGWCPWSLVNQIDDGAVPGVTFGTRVLRSQRWPPVGVLPLPESIRICCGEEVPSDSLTINNRAREFW